MERNGACTMLLLNTRHEDPTLHIGRVTPYYDTVAVLMSLTRMTNSMTERGGCVEMRYVRCGCLVCVVDTEQASGFFRPPLCAGYAALAMAI